MSVPGLPVGSIVASADRVRIKRGNADRQPPGSPFRETWWIEATMYAVPVPDGEIRDMLRAGTARVLAEPHPGPSRTTNS